MYKQASWDEKLVYELSKPGAFGILVPGSDREVEEAGERCVEKIPPELLRRDLPLPELSEPAVVRHFTRLSQMN
ncbi:MAG: aminomethyl-transferring glycine dehydrogenase subunit GcvPB, partial [Candidatus Caldarchaeum sp.]|nr:aminomethyl-transferring glycine dehydrogenase subunit GcvPB [Candidatus Caldarchaeum sp.]